MIYWRKIPCWDSLDKLVNRASQFEVVASDQSVLLSQSDNPVCHVYTPNRQTKKRQNRSSKSQAFRNSSKSVQKKETCTYCGEEGFHGKQVSDRKYRCPAFGKQCHKCHRQNHIASVCKAKETSDVNEVDTDSSEASAEAILARLNDGNQDTQEIHVDVTPDKDPQSPVNFKLFPDSGASICLGDMTHANMLGLDPSKMTQCYKRIKTVLDS